MDDPTFNTRAELMAWARQRMRYPDPAPNALAKALDDIKRVTIAHLHLPVSE
jgi:hypothetical protein